MFADLQRLTGITNHRLKLFKISHIIKAEFNLQMQQNSD